MGDLVLAWWAWVLSSPVGVFVVVPVVCVGAVEAGAGLGASWDRLASAAGRGVVSAAVVVAVHVPNRRAGVA